MTLSYFFDHALLPSGWQSDVRLECADGKITSVQAGAKPQPVDRRERLVVPGMPDLHSHAFQRAMAGVTERRGPGSDNFWSWRDAMYRFVRTMGPDEVEAIAAYAYADMLEAGFTSVGEFHYVHRQPDGHLYDNPAELALRCLAAAEGVGLDITILPVFYAASDFGGAPPTVGQRRFINSLESYAAILDSLRAATRGRVDRRQGVAPHSLRAAPADVLGRVLALEPDGPLHIHIAEQVKEVDDCIHWSGQRPVQWLLDNVGLDRRWCLVHATHMTPDETERFAMSGAAAGLCPITESNLGDGVFPAVEFLKHGGAFGVGSDSNVEIDAAGELRQLEYSQRLAYRARNVLSSADAPSTGLRLFQGAVAGGAQALGLPGAGLASGSRADFVALNADHPDLAVTSAEHWLDAWVFALGRGAVDKVFVGGKAVVEGGRHRDRSAVDARYRAAMGRLAEAGS